MVSAPVFDPVPVAQDIARRVGAHTVGYSPARANLIGEHLDYNGGPSLPITLPYWTYVAARPLDHPGLHLSSEHHGTFSDTDPATAPRAPRHTWTDYPVGVLQALRELPGMPSGIELSISSSVPEGSGLSSSASLTVAAAAALWSLASSSTVLPHQELLRVARTAENSFVGAPTGAMDQSAMLYARPWFALRFRPGQTEHEHIPWDPTESGADLLVVDTHVRHSHSEGGYGKRVAECRAAAGLLGVTDLAPLGADDEPWKELTDPVLARRARHVVTEADRTVKFEGAAHAGDMVAAGQLMTASHESLRDDYEVSCLELDLLVATALRHGALGARMTGGGFGGSALVLVDRGSYPRVAAAIVDAFGRQDLAEPTFLDGTAVGPAGVVHV